MDVSNKIWNCNISIDGQSFNSMAEQNINANDDYYIKCEKMEKCFYEYTRPLHEKIVELNDMIHASKQSGNDICNIESKPYTANDLVSVLEYFYDELYSSAKHAFNVADSSTDNYYKFTEDCLSPGEIKFDVMRDACYELSDMDDKLSIHTTLTNRQADEMDCENIDYYNKIEMIVNKNGCSQAVSHVDMDDLTFLSTDIFLLLENNECKDSMRELAKELNVKIQHQRDMSNKDISDENDDARAQWNEIAYGIDDSY